MSQPYVSVAFVNRNDNYGGDLAARIEKFISYYSDYARRWPGLFEFVICDWNPPPDRPRLRDAFAWDKLDNVLHIEVPPDVHAKVAGSRGRAMLDYVGRNVAIRGGSGVFSLVLNQDIFVSRSILELIGEKRLSERCFYRADRCDFDFEPCRDKPPQQFEEAALRSVFMVHRRHSSHDLPISVSVTPETIIDSGSKPEDGDIIDPESGIIDCQAAEQLRCTPNPTDEVLSTLHRQFYLHTNASGDFILAPRQAFADIHGMLETTNFYLHLDTYAVVQLFTAGYRQRIFAQPHRVFHADHDRQGRSDYKEEVPWIDHEMLLSRIIAGARSYKLNQSDWGLASYKLPRIRAGKS